MVSRVLLGSTRDLIIAVSRMFSIKNNGDTCMDTVSQSSKVAVIKLKLAVVMKFERTGGNKLGASRMISVSASRTAFPCSCFLMNRSLNR